MINLQENTYNQVADHYAAIIATWAKAEFSLYHHLILPLVLRYLGDIANQKLLDAGCGEGYLARLLASRGAQVTAIDVAPRLIELAQTQDPQGLATYQVHDLSQPLPPYAQFFDLVVSNLVLNDVPDYRGYIATLGAVTKPGGRLVLSMNNPYSAVIREKVQSYFDADTAILYRGLAGAGVPVYFFHRTLEQYITAFSESGFLLRRLSDAPIAAEQAHKLPEDKRHYRFPFFMILEFVKEPCESPACQRLPTKAESTSEGIYGRR
jgi:2-polyprenyl-3-methyl-5-hydroxy-6-metoxy-1,4-benzoquinol methylase